MRMRFVFRTFTGLVSVALLAASAFPADWKPAQGPLITRWAKDVSPTNALPEYPRPQMVRKDWQNLNGLWHFAFARRPRTARQKFDGQILVPFPVESALSGVMKHVSRRERSGIGAPSRSRRSGPARRAAPLRRRRLGGDRLGQRQEASAPIRGGYDAFSLFDSSPTSARRPDGEQELVVRCRNPTDAGTQPRGKQVRKPGGIFYTPAPASGRPCGWSRCRRRASIAQDRAGHRQEGSFASPVEVAMTARRGRIGVRRRRTAKEALSLQRPTASKPIDLAILEPKLWSPESPFLYGLMSSSHDGKSIDAVDCYFGMRKIAIGKDDKGVTRHVLNNKPLFLVGPLDQGFWPDGLYTAPTDEALKYDIEMTKKLGFNMTRKHVKVEPDRWYYWCDKLGLCLAGHAQRRPRDRRPTSARSSARRNRPSNYERELKRMIDGRRNHPSIVMWVVFNEGWGQFDTPRITEVGQRTTIPSRLVDCASGWNDSRRRRRSRHPRLSRPRLAAARGAAGGRARRVRRPGPAARRPHLAEQENWGYRSFNDRDDLTDAYLEPDAPPASAHRRPRPVGRRLHADDRRRDRGQRPDDLRPRGRQAGRRADRGGPRKLFSPPPKLKVIVPTSEKEPQTGGTRSKSRPTTGPSRIRRLGLENRPGRLRHQRHARRRRPHRVEDRRHLASPPFELPDGKLAEPIAADAPRRRRRGLHQRRTGRQSHRLHDHYEPFPLGPKAAALHPGPTSSPSTATRLPAGNISIWASSIQRRRIDHEIGTEIERSSTRLATAIEAGTPVSQLHFGRNGSLPCQYLTSQVGEARLKSSTPASVTSVASTLRYRNCLSDASWLGPSVCTRRVIGSSNFWSLVKRVMSIMPRSSILLEFK